jgi:hypothetical protein
MSSPTSHLFPSDCCDDLHTSWNLCFSEVMHLSLCWYLVITELENLHWLVYFMEYSYCYYIDCLNETFYLTKGCPASMLDSGISTSKDLYA